MLVTLKSKHSFFSSLCLMLRSYLVPPDPDPYATWMLRSYLVTLKSKHRFFSSLCLMLRSYLVLRDPDPFRPHGTSEPFIKKVRNKNLKKLI